MITLLAGDCREVLATLPAQSIQTIVTSPPYYGLRKYGDDPREIGQEPTPAAYVAALVAVFAACWRVLRDDGTLWLNLGDSYSGSWGNYGGQNRGNGTQRPITNGSKVDQKSYAELENWRPPTAGDTGLPAKNLLGIPWRVAFALQDAGWILRSDIIWSKPNPMPESVRDRPTRAHEYMFLFAKRQKYFYDATAIAEAVKQSSIDRAEYSMTTTKANIDHVLEHGTPKLFHMDRMGERFVKADGPRNRRTVWTIATQPYAGAHFATMPEALVEPCILAGSAAQACETCGAAWRRIVEREKAPYTPCAGSSYLGDNRQKSKGQTRHQSGGLPIDLVTTTGFAPACRCETNTGAARSTVLDPFGGSGTVARVAERHQRDSILIDLNPNYIDLQEERTNGVQVEMQLC
jgi:DNA modification methylase